MGLQVSYGTIKACFMIPWNQWGKNFTDVSIHSTKRNRHHAKKEELNLYQILSFSIREKLL